MFTLGNLICFAVAATTLATLYGVLALTDEIDKKRKIVTIVIEVIVMAALIVGCGVYNTRTESGKRSVKTWKSETSGGIDRTVTVYDINGQEVARYAGRFDVEESSQEGVVKIKFDCNGKRHIVYAQTGTVLIDEN